MARMRYVKPTFWTDSRMVRLSRDARLFYIGTWNFALCDKGHLEDDPVQLKMQIFPADDVDVQALMNELSAAGRLIRVTDGKDTWLQVATLELHQKVDPRWTPRCPACKASENLSETQESLGEALTSGNATKSRQNPGSAQNLSETLRNSPQEGRGGEGIGEKEPPVVPHDDAAVEESKTPARKRATKKPLPDDWKPKEHHVTKARELGIDGRREEEKFRLHAGANDRRQVDWDKSFTAWLLNAQSMGNVRSLPVVAGPPKPKPRPLDPDAPFQPPKPQLGEENRWR